MCALAQDFLEEQDFPERNLLQRGTSYRWSPYNPRKNALREILL
jgi:hypothetical protein